MMELKCSTPLSAALMDSFWDSVEPQQIPDNNGIGMLGWAGLYVWELWRQFKLPLP